VFYQSIGLTCGGISFEHHNGLLEKGEIGMELYNVLPNSGVKGQFSWPSK